MFKPTYALRRAVRLQRGAAYSTASSSLNNAQKQPDKPRPEDELSDREWDIQTGRAIDLIHKTLPQFFLTGLVTSIEKSTGDPCTSSPIPIPVVNSNPLKSHPELEPIYSPHIRLMYTPPTPLPAPFPKTLQLEGFPMYIASSAFVRHTLNAIYSDTHLVLQKFAVNDPRTDVSGQTQSSSSTKLGRDKSLTVAFSVHGNARVSGTAGQWDVHSTYTFSPISGLVHLHTVNSILPAPHQTVFDSLRASLGNIFGSGKHPETGAGAACREKTR